MVAAPPVAPELPVVRLVRLVAVRLAVCLDADVDAAAFEALLLGAGFLLAAAFDPAACVFAFFAGALAARAAFLGAPAGGVLSGGVTRAS